jgi:hypothetical protein
MDAGNVVENGSPGRLLGNKESAFYAMCERRGLRSSLEFGPEVGIHILTALALLTLDQVLVAYCKELDALKLKGATGSV